MELNIDNQALKNSLGLFFNVLRSHLSILIIVRDPGPNIYPNLTWSEAIESLGPWWSSLHDVSSLLLDD